MQQVIRLKKEEITTQDEKIEESKDIDSSFTSFNFFNNLRIYLEHFNYINFAISTLRAMSKTSLIFIHSFFIPFLLS
jgi:hypothetical protein